MLSVCASDLLDDGLHADHRPGDAAGSHAGLEVDDPPLRHPQHHPPLPLQGATSSSSSSSPVTSKQRHPVLYQGNHLK